MTLKTVAVFCGSATSDGDPNYGDAVEIGRLLTEAGFHVCTGGYQGSMEAVSKGAKQAGGKPVGFTTEEFKDYNPNRYLDRIIHHPHIYGRLERFITQADGFIVLRGGVGTLTELFLAWSLSQAEKIREKPIVLLGAFWNRLLGLFKEELTMKPEDYRLVHIAENPAEAVALIKRHLLDGHGVRRALG